MKLESVNKTLTIKIEDEEIRKYLTALDKVITDNNERTTEINTLKNFSIELTKLLDSVRD